MSATTTRVPSPNVASSKPCLSHEERMRLLAEELDALRLQTFAKVGRDDVAHVKRVRRFSVAMDVLGRAAIHCSIDPVTFAAGVTALWLHKQLEAAEIGHTVLHGAYDGLDGAAAFTSKAFRWDIPIDEAAWREGHNVKHHGATNVAGLDPDMCFGDVRLTDQSAWRPRQRHQLPVLLGIIFPAFAFVMNSHFTGLNDVVLGHGDTLGDRSSASIRRVWERALRKYVPYYLKNYVFFPALAGPMFGKVLLGNALAELGRDLYSAATIICGHVGPEVKSWPAGTRAHGRGEWYAMQVEASNDFAVILPLSILCGGLDHQIEHHLFPTLAPPRLREIAPRVRQICERYGVDYRKETWPATLRKAFRHIGSLSYEGARSLASDGSGEVGRAA